MRTESEVLTQFDEWAQSNELIRAAVLSGSRTNPNSKPDFLSDYDIALYVKNLIPFQENDNWLNMFGSILVRWPLVPRSTYDAQWITRLILFEDRVRIDFQITEEKQVDPNTYDNGYRVLIDKDGITENLNPPTFSVYNIKKPSRMEYEALVYEFWWDATYVPKYLWRDELPYAKYMLDDVLRYSYLHRLIEWYIGLQHDWTISTGCYGKWFKRYLNAEKWTAYQSTYAHSNIEENWEAFSQLVHLFRKLGMELSEKLGYEYPIGLDEEVSKYNLVTKGSKKEVPS